MELQLSIFVTTLTMSLVIACYTIYTQPRRFMHRSFATLVISLSAWSACLVSIHRTHEFAWSAAIFMSGAVWFTALLFFSYSFPTGSKPPRRFYLLALPAAAIFVLAPFDVFISGIQIDHVGHIHPINNYVFLIPFVVVCVSYVGYSLLLIARKYQANKHNRVYRMQFRYLFTGVSILLGAILVFDTILPALGISKYILLGPVFSVLFFALTSYAIVRHRLLDIRFVIQRGVVYTAVLGVMISIYTIGLTLFAHLLHLLSEESALVSAGITTTVGILFVRPLEAYFRRKTDHIFYKDSYDYAEALQTLSRVLQTSLNREDILSTSKVNLERIFKTQNVEFVFDSVKVSKLTELEQEPGFDTATRAIIFEGQPTGYVRLGPKRSGDAYTKQDLQLLSTFAYQAAIALGKADLHDEVRRYSTQLEALVEERTAEIRHMQEHQKQTMIDISHNLQTPLAIIRNEIDAVGEDTEESARFESLRSSIDRVSGFIRQLLHLARLEHSLYAVASEPVCLSSLLKEQAEYFEVMAEQHGVRIESAIEADCTVVGDKRLLEELFVNLITNAIAYKHQDRDALICIELKQTEGFVTASVRDNGIGIAKKDLPEIFRRFYRVPHPNHPTQGTGLGLSIVENIAKKHGASVSVQSTLGQGTTFIVKFPALTV